MIKSYITAIVEHKINYIIYKIGEYYLDNNLCAVGLQQLMDLYDKTRGDSDCDAHIQKYICKILATDTKLFLSFIDKHKSNEAKIVEQENYITELELMPEGPKYAEARDRFTESVKILEDKTGGLDDED